MNTRRTLLQLGVCALGLWALAILLLGPLSSWTLAASSMLRGAAKVARSCEKAAGAMGVDDDSMVCESLGAAGDLADKAAGKTAAVARGMMSAGVAGAVGVLVLVAAALGVRAVRQSRVKGATAVNMGSHGTDQGAHAGATATPTAHDDNTVNAYSSGRGRVTEAKQRRGVDKSMGAVAAGFEPAGPVAGMGPGAGGYGDDMGVVHGDVEPPLTENERASLAGMKVGSYFLCGTIVCIDPFVVLRLDC